MKSLKRRYDKLVKKVIAIDTSRLVKKANYSAKMKDIEDKMPIITNLVTTVALNNVENKIPEVSSLVKKAEYETKKIS